MIGNRAVEGERGEDQRWRLEDGFVAEGSGGRGRGG